MNADTLFFATKDLNISEINPFTNEKLTKFREKENIIELPIEKEFTWNAVDFIDKTQFNLNGPTYIIKDNIFKAENWTIKEEN